MIISPSRNGLVTIFVHPHNAVVPVKVVNVSTAPTAGVIQEMKDLQTEEIFDSRYAVDVNKLRSIKPSPRAIAECRIDRKKFLRIGVSMGMRAARAMRSVFCWTLRQEIILRTAPDLLTSTMALQSRLARVEAAAWVLDDPRALSPCCVLQTGLYTHPCQAGRTSRRGPGVVTPSCPRLSFSRTLLDGPEGSAEEIE
jgi:hypothetical protein